MTDLRYRNKLEIDVDGSLITPTIVLCTRSGKKIGVLQNIQSLKRNHPMNDVAEMSFDVYKYADGKKEPCWDSIKNFKLICLPTEPDNKYKWYEIAVNIDETTDTIKHVTCIHANEAELGQLMLYDVEINTEDDIARDDYETITIGDKEYGTVFYNPEHPKNSLLHRILADKASHYQIIHVDDTLKNIQREFSFNGTSIVDALNQTIGQEIQCLFVFGESLDKQETNDFQRTISAYDLLDYCEDCGERGNYSGGVCTHCGSTNITSGYGKDTGIFINTENLTDSISFTSATDQVKNFFRMTAGDEDMTAAIRNCNPNGSAYLVYFSKEMQEDMSDELKERLNEYNIIYDSYLNTEAIALPSSDIGAYNSLIDKYQNYSKEELPVLYSEMQGFNTLTNYDYNAVNFRDFLQTTMMPKSSEVTDTTAEEQIELLTIENMSPIGVEDYTTMSLTACNTAVKDYAKVYVDTSLYKIDVSDSTYVNNTWSGTITLTSYVDEDDMASVILNIIFNNDGATFLRQKIEKAMAQHKVEDIGDVSFLNKSVSEIQPELVKYSLDSLSLLDDICSSVMDILAQAGQGEESSPYYSDFYYPYWQKRQMIMAEESVRENEIKTVEKVIQDIDSVRNDIINYLNMESFFGNLYSELMLYRRETEYSNTNFVSDGLTDSEIIDKAQEFFKRAQEEIIKASTVQHSISGNLYNLFLIPEFRQIVKDDSILSNQVFDNKAVEKFLRLFESGNWLRVRVDDEVYKLRMTNWEIDYTSPEQLDVEFSDVIYGNGTMSDIASLLSQARTMASSYNTVMRQAEKGNEANSTINKTKKQGLLLNQNKIISDINEQSFVIDTNGALMRAKNDFDDGYSNEQVKLLNKGIYYTNDSWETVKAGLGHFIYYDPETRTTREDYGIIASTIVGQLLLGENLKIYSESGKFEMGDNGLIITAVDGEDNTDLFVVQKEKTDEQGRKYVEKYIYVDSNGEVQIRGNSVVLGGKPLIEYIDDAISDAEIDVSLPVTVQIDSSTGVIFNTDNISTTLTATVYRGGEDITSQITQFEWIKKDKNGNIDTSWTRTTATNSINVNINNINEKVIIGCGTTVTQDSTTTAVSGSITISKIHDGSQFWTSTTTPISPDYTFNISDLVGDTNADIKEGDIIYYSHYRYTVTSVTSNGTTVLCGNRENLRGVDGISPTVKSIVCSHAAVVCEKDGLYNPTAVTFNGQAQTQDTIESYEGWFKIELSSDTTTWVSSYTSASKESFVNYRIPLGLNITKDGILYYQGSTVTTNGSVVDSNFTITSDGVIETTQDIGFIIRSIRCSLYSDANMTNLIDQQRVNIAFDGVDGDNGDDGYTVVLTNENHTFAGNTISAINGDFTECEVIAYKGGLRIPTYIGAITGMPTGMTVAKPINNATNSKFVVTVSSAMITQNGVLDVPVTVEKGTLNEKTFNMKFTYSLKLNGLDSTGLGWMVNYSTPTTSNDGKCIYYGFDEITKQPSYNKDGWVLWNGQEIVIPHGCFINPNDTMPYNTTIYSVYRLPTATTYTGGTFHDVAWIENTNIWRSNTYNGSNSTIDSAAWVWNEDTDIILAMYVEPSNDGTITNAQLFTPSKKYSELVEPAKKMAKDAEKIANYYIKSEASTGTMFANMSDGIERLPSNIPSGYKNILIKDDVLQVRDGQDVLASYGGTTTIGKKSEKHVKIDQYGVDIKNGEKSLASYGETVRIGQETLPHLEFGSGGMIAYKNKTDKYYEIGDGSSDAVQRYIVPELPLILNLSHPVESVTSISIDNTVLNVDQYEWASDDQEITILDRPVGAINKIDVTYTYEISEEGEETSEGDEQTVASITDSFERIAAAPSLEIEMDYRIISGGNVTVFQVLIGNVVLASDKYIVDTTVLEITERPTSGSTVTIQYHFEEQSPYFTFNKRKSGVDKGNSSVSFGNESSASGDSSFATGIETSASGHGSFVGGNKSVASGAFSGTIGEGTTASGIGSFACGRYNVKSSEHLFSVGNGTEQSPSDAFYVSTDGTAKLYGDYQVGKRFLLRGQLRGGVTGGGFIPMFSTKALVKTVGTVSANSTRTSLRVDVTRNGYLPMAVSGIRILNKSGGHNASRCNIYNYKIVNNSNESHITFSIANLGNTDATLVKVEFTVFYIAKNAVLGE